MESSWSCWSHPGPVEALPVGVEALPVGVEALPVGVEVLPADVEALSAKVLPVDACQCLSYTFMEVLPVETH